MKVYGIIYLITNLVNGKVYIGQTTRNIRKRFSDHYYNSKNKSPKYVIAKAIKKYNKENFTIQQIDIAYNQEELNLLEGVYISWFNSLIPNGYNMANIINGKGKSSEQTKEKIRQKANEPHRISLMSNIGKQTRGIAKKNSTCKYRGVKSHKNKWIARYRLNGKLKHIGLFSIEEDAAKARDIAELKYLGDNAILNFPELKEEYLNA